MKERLTIVLILMLALAMLSGVPAFAWNLEQVDEIELGAKVQANDLILKTKHVDVGVEVGVWNINYLDGSDANAYAMGVVELKEIHILNRLLKFFKK